MNERHRDMYGILTKARLLGEQQLTALGERDAPVLVREIRNEHRLAGACCVRHWRTLREQLAPLCADQRALEALAPYL